jgi:chaperonin GroEL
MINRFSIYKNLEKNICFILTIYNTVKVTLGPIGRLGLLSNKNGDISFLSNICSLLSSFDSGNSAHDTLLKLLDQSSMKTLKTSGDGSTITVLIACKLLINSLRYVSCGYNALEISDGLKQIAHFLKEKILELSLTISTKSAIESIIKTAAGNKLNFDLINFVCKASGNLERDGLLLVEDNTAQENEIEFTQGIELDSGFASSYFVTDINKFEIQYYNPYVLILHKPLNNAHLIKNIIEHIKKENRPLVIIVEQIAEEILSSLVLNSIQKKFKVVVIKYSAIKFIKTGILEDLALLSYFSMQDENKEISPESLGQIEKIIVQKNKSVFLFSKHAKILANRRTNELNRELLLCETNYERDIFKVRVARLKSNLVKIKLGFTNQSQIQDERKKIENILTLVGATLEEGVLPGGGSAYLYLKEELKNWGYVNLVGDQIYAITLVAESLMIIPLELLKNANIKTYSILNSIESIGFPFSYNIMEKRMVHAFQNGLIDSAKQVRSSIWNALTISATIISSLE